MICKENTCIIVNLNNAFTYYRLGGTTCRRTIGQYVFVGTLLVNYSDLVSANCDATCRDVTMYATMQQTTTTTTTTTTLLLLKAYIILSNDITSKMVK